MDQRWIISTTGHASKLHNSGNSAVDFGFKAQLPGFQDIVLVIAGLLGDHTRTKLGLRALGEGFVPNRIKFVMNIYICSFAQSEAKTLVKFMNKTWDNLRYTDDIPLKSKVISGSFDLKIAYYDMTSLGIKQYIQ